MPTYRCPSCGAEIKFQSPVSVTCVCPFCRSLIVRHDKDVQAFGKMAALPDDVSPFQLGTEGVYKGTHFSLIGRMTIGWEDGRWNEWFILVDSGAKGWLAEAQGFLAVSFEKALPDEVEKRLRSASLGDDAVVDDEPFRVVDIKDAECIGCEGELPLLASKGRKARSIDLISRSSRFASIEFPADRAAPRFYVGDYVAFDQLRFSRLRELPGWKMPLTAAAPAEGQPRG
jgi:hypothetical protein